MPLCGAAPSARLCPILHEKLYSGKLFSRNLRISYGNYAPVRVNPGALPVTWPRQTCPGDSMVLPLSHIPPASDARIIWIASEPVRRERLTRQGFVPDEMVRCVRRSRRRRFFLFRVRGRLILLPRKLAGEIFAEVQS